MNYEKKSVPPKEFKILMDAFNALPKYHELHEADAWRIYDEYSRNLREVEKSKKDVGPINQKYGDMLEKVISPEIRAAFEGKRLIDFKFEIAELKVEASILEAIVAHRVAGQSIVYLPRGIELQIRIRPDNTVVPYSRILDIFDLHPIDRVRFCSICKTIFWARKSNAETCSADCATKRGNQVRLEKKKKGSD